MTYSPQLRLSLHQLLRVLFFAIIRTGTIQIIINYLRKRGIVMMELNGEAITVQDCIDMYEKRDMCTILDSGKIVGFVEREDKQ